ncbi:pentaheme c-type cytochrome TorC [Shewanella marina]|uniref:pentaheme c-type cytochrome TorC n=1 Tax=Shewanella marina TaxID=487319 RepID=UPI000471FA80|nr:pentaheme c-type cytochrome TorC [Shewanella marina]
MKKIWQFFSRPSSKYSVLTIAIIAIFISLLGVFTFHESIEYSSSTEFCVSCHSMKENYNEYKNTIHFKNPMGVRAECRNCHIPENNPIDFMKAKLGGVGDIYSEFISKDINTPLKFEQHRQEMAENVWNMMKETNSAPCKSCHSYTAMDHAKQSPAAAAAMTDAEAKNMNCIECHKGIAHQLPMMNEDFHKVFDQLKANSSIAPPVDTLFTLTEKTIYSEATDSSLVEGKLLPASKVTVISKQNGMLQVKFSGWHEKSAQSAVITQDMGKFIVVAKLKEAGKATEKLLKEQTDAKTGMVWQQVEITGWINQKYLQPNIKMVWQYAEGMYNNTCSACHAATAPNFLTANKWIDSMKAMKPYYSLTPTEEQTLLKYLQVHAKDMPNAKGATPAK